MGMSTLLPSNGEYKTLGLMWDVKNDVFNFEPVINFVLMGNPQCQAVQNEDSPVWRGMVFISIINQHN